MVQGNLNKLRYNLKVKDNFQRRIPDNQLYFSENFTPLVNINS